MIVSIDGAASIFYLYTSLEALDHAIVSGSFLPPYAQASFHLNKSFHCCIAGSVRIKPRPPAQEASTLSITSLPLEQFLIG